MPAAAEIANWLAKYPPDQITRCKELDPTSPIKDSIDLAFKDDHDLNRNIKRFNLLNRIDTTLDHLKQNSYTEVTDPQMDDIVVYCKKDRVVHYGKIIENGKVIQKIADSDTFITDLHVEPFGCDKIFIMRKQHR